MIDVESFKGQDVAVLGLARSGLVSALALAAGGARVLAWDDSEAKRKEAAAAGVTLSPLADADFGKIRALVISPGIPHTFPTPHPVAARARAAGAEIIGDIELLARTQRQASYAGITGTNGKSTTTSLIAHILQAAGRKVAVGGNLGQPVLSLPALGDDGAYVIEMSSYQLELTHSLTFDVAVLLNITPDHLDRHGGMDGYVAAKRRIFDRQKGQQTAVIGVDDDLSSRLHEHLARDGGQRVIPISAERAIAGGVYVTDGMLFDATEGPAKEIMDLREVARLPGKHNWQNAAAAFASVRSVGVSVEDAVDGIRTFPGLAHRQELIATVDGIRYVNDSKATNADATEKALVCYDAIYWIAGGLAKEGGITSLSPYFPRIRRAYLIGEAAKDFAQTLDGKVDYSRSRSGTLDAALAEARKDALAEGISGAVVLLSPACASFDQFADFEARGRAFRSLVEALPGDRA